MTPLHSALELGCSTGLNLVALKDLGFQTLVGIDPSSAAVQAGKEMNDFLDLRAGVAESPPLRDDEVFDLVVFGFCLYLLDRHSLLPAIQQADKALRRGGVLAIIDFDCVKPRANDYHHKPGLSSFKMEYAAIFVATNEYQLIDKIALEASPRPQLHYRPDRDKDFDSDAVALWILKKESSFHCNRSREYGN